VSPASYPWDKYAYAEAITHFARALGASRSGDLETARKALSQLTAIQASLQGQKGFDWATQVEVQRRAAAAWLARAEKKDDEALSLLRSAAELEDSTDKHPVTPGSILPAREQLADLLLELGKPDLALAEYQASLKSAPARFNSYLGASRAADKAGQKELSKDFRDRLLAMCGGTTPERLAAAEGTK
jgi:tetratricopeptide (TPR) repeat protein